MSETTIKLTPEALSLGNRLAVYLHDTLQFESIVPFIKVVNRPLLILCEQSVNLSVRLPEYVEAIDLDYTQAETLAHNYSKLRDKVALCHALLNSIISELRIEGVVMVVLTICPTLSCNFNCPYCFEHDHPVGNMSREVEQKIVNFVKNHSAKSLSVTWFGGEPMLNFKTIRTLTNEFLKLPVIYHANMITNGYLLTANAARQLESLKITHVQITIDGPKEFHDSRRCLKNGGATFDVITNNLKHAASVCNNVTFSVRVNLDRSNCEYFASLQTQILGWGLSNVHVSPAFVTDYSAEQNNKDVMTPVQRKDFLIRLSTISGVKYDKFYPSNDRCECAVRNMNTFVVGPKGELYKCWNDVGNENRVYGTIDNKTVNEDVMFEYLLEGDPLEDEKCLNCLLFPRCGGGCPYNRLWNKHFNTEHSYCPLHKDYLDELLWTHYITKKQL